MEKNNKTIKIVQWVLWAIMLITLIMQFLPFWSIDGKGISMQKAIWFPEGNENLFTYLGCKVDDILIMIIVQMVCCIFGVIFYLAKKDSPFIVIIPLICSVAGIWGYLTNSAFQLGTLWIFNLVLNIVMLLLTIYSIVEIFKHMEFIK